MNRLFCIFVTTILVTTAAVTAAEFNLGDLPSGGLAVVDGAKADAHSLKIAAEGRWLVRVIATKPEQVPTLAIATQRLHPLVTVASAEPRLPFADDTVNAVLLGIGSTITTEEAHRVLAPGGVLLVESATGFTRAVEPEDPRYAPWTHWQADAHASGTSADTAVAPSTSIRWWGQNIVGAYLRTAGGVVGTFEEPLGPDAKSRPGGVQGRDVYSGVALWYRAKATSERIYGLRTAAVAHPLGFIHVQHGSMQPAVLTDLRTGLVKVTYDQGIKMPVKSGDPDGVLGNPKAGADGGIGQPLLVVFKDTLFQGYGHDVVALDVATGKQLWKTRVDAFVTKLVVSRDGARLYTQESQSPKSSYGRWGSYSTAALTALRTDNGQQIWKCMDLTDRGTVREGKFIAPGPGSSQNLSEIIEVGGVLYGFDQVTNIGSDLHGDLFAIDSATGKLKWHYLDINDKDPKQREYNKHGSMINNIVFWNGGLWGKSRNFSLTGPSQEMGKFSLMTGNDRCVRYAGSANYLITGFTSYVGKDFTSYQTGLTRGNCSMPNYATYGSILTATDETCSCYNGLRGQIALIPPLQVVPIDDSMRLKKTTTPSAASAPEALPDTALTQDWIPWSTLRFFPDHRTAGPVAVGSLTLRVDVQRHLVTAFRGEGENAPVAWRFRADGRVFTAPTVGKDCVYVSSAAGTITCLDATAGTPKWIFLAAPTRAETVVNGQLESRWPVYNTELKNGTLYAAAGRHAECDDGIWVWALDADSGAVQQSCRLFVPITVLKPGELATKGHPSRFRGERDIASNALLCGGIALDGDRVVLLNRLWNKNGSRPSNRGYWKNPADAKVDGPNLAAPNNKAFVLDLASWNGQVINPVDVLIKK